MPLPLLVAAPISAAVAAAAWRTQGVTGTGALAAWTVGTAILWGTGWAGGAVLLVFFVGSTAVERVASRESRGTRREDTDQSPVTGSPDTNPRPATPDSRPTSADPKGTTRDPWQVYANGGVAAAGALLGLHDSALGLWLVTLSLAAAAADTWATAIGCTSRSLPRSIVTGQTVPTGANGGITWRGTLGAAAGAALVAGAGALGSGSIRLFLAGVLLGFSGMIADSVLGATLQGKFRCPACGIESERRVHRCGTPTVPIGGVPWLTNDGVNLLATSLAALGGWCVWRWLSP